MFDLNQPWYWRYRNRIRLVDSGPTAGGSDSGDPVTGNTDNDESGDGENVDWKAKFEAERAHSRKWEQRAKDNSTAANELEKFKEAQLSESERTTKKIKDLEAKNAAYKAEKQQNEWKAQVSKQTGVPAELLHGDSLEAMSANAKAIDQYAHPKPKGMPNQGKTPDGKAAGTDERAWADNLFSNL